MSFLKTSFKLELEDQHMPNYFIKLNLRIDEGFKPQNKVADLQHVRQFEHRC